MRGWAAAPSWPASDTLARRGRDRVAHGVVLDASTAALHGREDTGVAYDDTCVDVYGIPPYADFVMATVRQTVTRERKTERLELRVSRSARRLIERATALSGLAAGDLAIEGARRVVEEHERMVLRGEDRDVFLRAILNPPRPATRLVAALRKRRKLGR